MQEYMEVKLEEDQQQRWVVCLVNPVTSIGGGPATKVGGLSR